MRDACERFCQMSGQLAVDRRPSICLSLGLQQLNSSLYAALHNKHLRFKRSLFASDGFTLSDSRANVDYSLLCQNRDFRIRQAQAIL
jgi:hypothetical protein